jgi:hypothetical protein
MDLSTLPFSPSRIVAMFSSRRLLSIWAPIVARSDYSSRIILYHFPDKMSKRSIGKDRTLAANYYTMRSYKLFRPFGASFSNNSLVLSYFLDSRNSLITHKLNMGVEVSDFFQTLTPRPHIGMFPKSILHLSVTDHSMVSIFRHRDE